MKKMFRIFLEFNKADEHLHALKKEKAVAKTKGKKNITPEDDNLGDLISKISQ
ncbi:MAG: hypothetical protein ACKVOU_07025 [Cytophagales bacterium]